MKEMSFLEKQQYDMIFEPVQTMYHNYLDYMKNDKEVDKVIFKAYMCNKDYEKEILLNKFKVIYKQDKSIKNCGDLEELFFQAVDEAINNIYEVIPLNYKKESVLSYIRFEYKICDKNDNKICHYEFKTYTKPVYILGVLKENNNHMNFYAGDPKELWKYFKN